MLYTAQTVYSVCTVYFSARPGSEWILTKCSSTNQKPWGQCANDKWCFWSSDHRWPHSPVRIAVGVTIQPLEGVGTQTSTSFSLSSNHIQFPSDHCPAVLSVVVCACVPQQKLFAFFFIVFFWSGFTAQHCPRWFLVLKLPGYIKKCARPEKQLEGCVCIRVCNCSWAQMSLSALKWW